MVSVYLQEEGLQALRETYGHLRKAVRDVRRDTGALVKVVIARDFNQQNQLWVEDEVCLGKQSEANPLRP